MPLTERIDAVDRIKSWSDKIPLHYEYTAGVAGERFLRGLKKGVVLAARCDNCGKMYLPPKMYCVDCYLEIKSYRKVGPAARVVALAGGRGRAGRSPGRGRKFAFLVFKGVTGGIIHYASGKGLEIGSTVVPRFRPPARRKGNLLDIEEFVKTRVRA